MGKPDQSLILVLGDQLSDTLPSLRAGDKARDVVLMAEVMAEANYVRHHKKKIIFCFSAMRHFAERLRGQGWQVDYVKLDDPGNSQNLAGEVARAKARHGLSHVVMTEPGEWRLREELARVEMLEDTRFLCSHAAFAQWAKGRRELRMEFFYRDMRRQTKLLMDGDQPRAGAGTSTRRTALHRRKACASRSHRALPPMPSRRSASLLSKKVAGSHFGDAVPFWFPVTAEEAERLLQHFLIQALPRFGETQDAMLSGEKFLNHSLISVAMNAGLLDPLAVCKRAEAEYRSGRAPLEAVEGFIRQIIGWREYIRGIYWLTAPGYVERNELAATRPIPAFYWTGKTDLNCLARTIAQTKEEAYAHHIQRLMVTGNFALLAGIDPKQVHEWYLAVYADAYEWVELPNTLGMALHADGGMLASKPYAASGNYINRMSDYCGGCRYDVKKRHGEGACPFNALYWDFIARHKQRFARNPRMANICRGFDRFSAEEQQAIRAHAQTFLDGLEPWVAE